MLITVPYVTILYKQRKMKRMSLFVRKRKGASKEPLTQRKDEMEEIFTPSVVNLGLQRSHLKPHLWVSSHFSILNELSY